MNKFLTYSICLSLAGSIGSVTSAVAETPTSNDYMSPYIDPQRDCLTEGMNNPEGKNYRYLYSRDCRVVHVLPPPVLPQNIKSRGVNLQACNGLASARNTLNTIDATIDQAHQRIRKLEDKLDKAKPAEEAALLTQITELNKRIDGYTKAKTDSVTRFDRDFNQLPGAVFSVLMDGNISQNDLNELRGFNLANLHRRRTQIEKTIGPDGKETVRTIELVDVSSLRPAQISQSYFSFLYSVPADAGKNGGLIATEIPNLQYLEQPGGRTGVLHVKANGAVTGKVVMSVTTACDRTKKDADNKIVLDETTDPFFSVNRTFFVQQMFAQGYLASLKIDKFVEQITKHTTTHTNEGFKKSSVFVPIIKADINEILKFDWVTQFDTAKNISLEKVIEIKNAVATKLIDNYVEKLIEVGALTKIPDKVVQPVPGGHVNETRVGHRCWTERDDGPSGWIGRRHEVCGDFTYSVAVWKDGITEETIRRSLTLNVEAKESMQLHTMAPFYFSTAFTNQ